MMQPYGSAVQRYEQGRAVASCAPDLKPHPRIPERRRAIEQNVWSAAENHCMRSQNIIATANRFRYFWLSLRDHPKPRMHDGNNLRHRNIAMYEDWRGHDMLQINPEPSDFCAVKLPVPHPNTENPSSFHAGDWAGIFYPYSAIPRRRVDGAVCATIGQCGAEVLPPF